MVRNPLQQFVRQFPLLQHPLFGRDRSLWEDIGEGLFPGLKETSGLTVYEQGNQLVVEAELPGTKEEEIEITYNKGVLSIRAEQLVEEGQEREEESKKGEDKRFYYRSQRSWNYNVTLPIPVDEAREPQATFNDGILRILFNKAQKDSLKRINIRKGQEPERKERGQRNR